MCLWLENKQGKEYPLITLTAAAASVRNSEEFILYRNEMLPKPKQHVFWKNNVAHSGSNY